MMKIILKSNTVSKDYKKTVKEVKNFFSTYNEILMSKVHKAFWRDFYFYKKNQFKIDIIISSLQQSLICIEKSKEKKEIVNVYFTEKNPQLFYIELKNDVNFTKQTFQSFIKIEKNGYSLLFCDNSTLDGSPIIVDVADKSFFAALGIKVSLGGNQIEKFVTEFPGVLIFIGAVSTEGFNKSFTKAAIDIFSYQFQEYYLKSELFRKASIHPILKNKASEIKLRKSQADNHIKEYPQWEFERDINSMRTIAKENNLTENYIDEIIKDPQYYPISGILLFYYSNEKSFMVQWSLINLIILVINIGCSYLDFINILTIQTFLSALVLAINAWIFNKKPDLISFKYWLIPFILGLFSFVIIYLQKIAIALICLKLY